LELIRKKNNLKNTLTKRRKKGDVHNDSYKLANVRPLHKSGNKRHVGNYRPISVLSPVNKIFEKVIYQRLPTFINKHGIVDEILGAIDGKKIVAGLFLNLKKAFDTIDHVILLKKLNTIGVRSVEAELLRNYFTNRLQTVCVNSECGSFLPVSVGVPQGSVLYLYQRHWLPFITG
jgi:hypothetical protein